MSVTDTPSWLTVYSKDDLDAIATQAYNAAATVPANTDAGSSVGSIFTGNEFMVLFAQAQIVRAALYARLATCFGGDVDSFCAAFNVTRIGANYATTYVQANAASIPSSPIYIPVGAVVATETGVQFAAIADDTNAAYNPATNQYEIPAYQPAINVTCQCLIPGTAGNVAANTLTQPISGWPSGVGSLTNVSAVTDGYGVETDAAYKARFTQQISTGRTGTLDACAAAVLATQAGLTISTVDQITAQGAAQSAYFTVVVAELGQTGSTPSSLLALAIAALEGSVATGTPATRSAGISYAVISPTISTVTASATITISTNLPSGSTATTVLLACETAFANYISSIGLDPYGGTTVASLGQVYFALLSVPGVVNVDALLLNGLASDVTAGFGVLLAAGATSFVA